ncbi:DNA-binding transcriptional regulator KdgR [Pokkaliibacter plantistimulans]|uniref:DNA-binding transcriptional regulator KdgR n=1 Tax=Proteobacteria bacterium 228 TaxID=2083153 RepID=A0A2S5KQC8_9PROT|nr:DNA-binding transcriptional regulator KdgR [Pokkaliibacter plantistimulans]PPC77047.1 DNA-binding transcriptional regulator KdgR [Pokkaliibacter plantistimulans]
MSNPDTQPDSVSSVMKVFGILQALSDEHEIGITELSQRVLMSKSTVYRFLQTMKSLGYVSQDGDNDKYSLTLKLFELGAKVLQHVDLIRIADKQMRQLSGLTRETIHLGAFEDDSIVYIHKIDSQYHLRMHSRIGRRNPLHSTAIGKVLMAWRDREEALTILRRCELRTFTANTIIDLSQLELVLDTVKAQGFAEDREEMEEGVYCIAVPIFDRFGHITAALSISFPAVRFNDAQQAEYVAMLHSAAKAIGIESGFTGYPF